MKNSNDVQANSNDQLNVVYNAFFEAPKTMKEVDKETGIMRESICRYVKILRATNRIAIVSYRKCKVTGHEKVGTYSTNPDLFPKSSQLELF